MQGALERFRMEGHLAGSITDPHCVFVYAADQWQGQPYIAMELVPGHTLEEEVGERGPLPWSEAISRVCDLIDGVHAAHQHGVIHRDIKPSNCFVDRDGRVKIGDFGLSLSPESRAEEESKIFVLDLASATDRRITRRPGFDGAPSWSPDGRYIAFHGNVGDTFDIFIVDADGSNLVNITQDSVECYQPGWTSDGTRLLYCAGTGPEAYDIWIVNADGAARRQLTHHSARDEAPTVRPR